MDAQTSLPQQYEDPQEVSIEFQQRLEAKISKTVKLQALVKPTIMKNTTPVHSHCQSVTACAHRLTGDKAESVGPFQQRVFFWTLTSCVHQLNR
jgi:hypothetical protein